MAKFISPSYGIYSVPVGSVKSPSFSYNAIMGFIRSNKKAACFEDDFDGYGDDEGASPKEMKKLNAWMEAQSSKGFIYAFPANDPEENDVALGYFLWTPVKMSTLASGLDDVRQLRYIGAHLPLKAKYETEAVICYLDC